MAVGIATLTVSSLASGAVGDLTYRGCITGETESGPPGGGGTGACAAIADASSAGASSGLDGLESVALSRDGRSLYTASAGDDAVAWFRRNRDTGQLTYRGCISGESGNACTAIPDASAGGSDSGLDGLAAVAVSRDGKSLYAVSGGDSAVARFRRNRDTGQVAYRGCITGETQSGPPGGGGTGACTAISGASSLGTDSGLDDLESVALSRDGKFLYAASGDDAAVARFRRNRDTGQLAYRGCISGDEDSACREIPGASPGGFGEGSGLDNLQELVLSGDGRWLYAASAGDDAVARFRRNRDTGRLNYRGCIGGDTNSACREIPDASAGGVNSGFDELASLALSRDGRSLYTASGGDDAVARFRRNRDTGRLTYRNCITGESQSGGGGTGACAAIPGASVGGDNSGLDDLESAVLSGDGKSLYVAAGDDAAVARFRRKRDTARLTYRGCVSGDSESACREIPDATPGGFGEESGLDNPQALALSGDGRSLYAASLGDDAVARFRRER